MSSNAHPDPSPVNQQTTPRQWLWRIISLLVALALVVFMLSLIDWSAFLAVLRQLSLWSLLASFGVYVILNFFRALRYRTLLQHENTPLAHLFPIGLWHNFLVRLLPFKLGEITYPVMLRQRLAVPVEDSVSSLFGARLLELLVIVIIAAGSLLLAGDVLPGSGAGLIVLMLLVTLAGVFGLYYAGALLRVVVGALRRLARFSVVERLSQRLDVLALKFDRLRQPRVFVMALVWSLCTYACSFGVNAILLYAVGVQPEPAVLIILVSLGMFASAFPFNISGFGAVELSWAFGLTLLLGYSAGEGTSIGLMLNGYHLICAGISGSLGWLVVQWLPDTVLSD